MGLAPTARHNSPASAVSPSGAADEAVVSLSFQSDQSGVARRAVALSSGRNRSRDRQGILLLQSTGNARKRPGPPTPVLPPFTLLISFLLAGCANPGPPRPPSLHIPEPVTDLAARRVGDTLELTWTTPSRSTDDLPLKGPLTAELCEAPASTAEAACQPVLTLSVLPGSSHAILPLPPGTLTGPPALLVVRVRIRNSAGGSADPFTPAFTAVGPAPPPVTELRVAAMQGGARIQWTRIPGSAPVLLHRTLLTPPPPQTGNHPTETDLQAADPDTTDPGGTLDRTAQEGSSYRYTAQRLRTVTLDGHPVHLLSLPSTAVTVRIHDVFPPVAPTGLASIPGTPGEVTPTIELSWEASSEPDLAGYFIDRLELAAGTAPPPPTAAWIRLTPTFLVVPAFEDATVEAGHRYLYRILAVDTSGNQSPPSTPIEETAAVP